MRYKFEGGRRESALAFRLLQEMLREQMSEAVTESLEFEIGEHGKPSLKGMPDVHFNISHCKHAVACAVDNVPVGIDIECRGRYSKGIAEYCLSEEELSWINHVPDGMSVGTQTDLRFTTLWTKKEALLKLLGTGITDDVKTILHEYEDKVVFETVTKDNYVCTVAKYK